MINNNPLVSIILTTLNREYKLRKAIESCINQTYKNIEIIIGDNNSTDGTEKLCREYSNKDSRIKYYRHKENIGAFNNITFLYKQMNGDYYIRLDDDDWIDENYIEQSLNIILNNPDYVFVSPSVNLYNTNYKLDKNCYIPDLTSDNVFKRIEILLFYIYR